MVNPPRKIEAVYLPSNEPYLGNPALLALDQFIPGAMKRNAEIAARTFEIDHSPLQAAACELVPQGISIALSIRELLRQGYLFSAMILLRPLLERLALLTYLRDTPAAVASWHQGWPRKDQPSFMTLLSHLEKANAANPMTMSTNDFAKTLHKVVHGDPAAAIWNMTEKNDRPAHASGKLVDCPEGCDFCAVFTHRCLMHFVAIAESVFPPST